MALLDDVARTGESIHVLKRGKVVARLIPAFEGDAETPQASLMGTVRTLGDLLAPTGEDTELDSVTGRELGHS